MFNMDAINLVFIGKKCDLNPIINIANEIVIQTITYFNKVVGLYIENRNNIQYIFKMFSLNNLHDLSLSKGEVRHYLGPQDSDNFIFDDCRFGKRKTKEFIEDKLKFWFSTIYNDFPNHIKNQFPIEEFFIKQMEKLQEV